MACGQDGAPHLVKRQPSEPPTTSCGLRWNEDATVRKDLPVLSVSTITIACFLRAQGPLGRAPRMQAPPRNYEDPNRRGGYGRPSRFVFPLSGGVQVLEG